MQSFETEMLAEEENFAGLAPINRKLPANYTLERDIAELLTRPVGRPSHKPVVWYKSFLYQAASWKKVRRIAALPVPTG